MYKLFKYAFNLFVVFLFLAAGYFSFGPVNFNEGLITYFQEETISPTQEVDLIILLGAGLRTGGMLTDLAQERVDYAVEVAEKRDVPILFSGGDSPFGVEAHAMYEEAVHQGYEGVEHHEGSSTSTYENAYFSDILLDEADIPSDRVLVITSPYHSKRAYATFEDLMPERDVFIDYPNDSAVLEDSFLGRWKGIRILVREFLATYYYFIRFGIKPNLL